MGSSAPPHARPTPHWAPFNKVREWPAVGDGPQAAKDHGGGRYVGVVRVSPKARKAYLDLTRGTDLPVGSVVAMFHETVEKHAPGPVYVMEKQPGGWRYLVLSSDGRIRESGVLPLCERCHAEARADHLFGLPAGSPTPAQP